MINFTHLHVHTQYSILDGAAEIKKLIKKTKELGMDSIAITDHGNMYGVLEFHNVAREEGVKPILGCEMYVSRESRFIKNGKNFSGDHLILLAKNEKGYQNLIKLDSLAFEPNAFYRTSRIDKELLFQNTEGLICCSACLGGEIPQYILSNNIPAAENAVEQYKNAFGDDYYIELQNHGSEDQLFALPKLIEIANKFNVKIIATNDVHYVQKDDFDAHRILICLNTGKKLSEDTKLMYTGHEYLKSPSEMLELFKDYPQAISNTQEIVDKVEVFNLKRDPILPVFDIPKEFGTLEEYFNKYPVEKIEEEFTQEEILKKGGYEKIISTKFDAAYLRHLTYEGAKRRYKDNITDEIKERIDFELNTIEWMGFPGYFLIVQDFINHSQKELDVIVGPGRGSAAGSVVAYCLGITAIDPIKYGLLFERFLNPDRISLPDVDVDFDDDGRDRVLEYVQNKYGADHVAQIVTFGTMAAKSSIRDVARVLELPLSESDRLAKLVPEKPGTSLEKAFDEVPELKDALENGSELVKKTLKFAKELEGSVRNTGTHACGVIIGPDSLSKYIPLCTAKDSNMMATQFEGKFVESVGMIKMDFLGLKTLSIIKDACSNVHKSKGLNIDIQNISLEDEETFKLFQRGDSIGTFQFESEGMRQHMQNLKPDRFEDLIAMNALYRPGPMQYIPNYIARKHGYEEIKYEFPQLMEKYLSETYGITVYQEQVMQLSQAMAGFTKGQADKLRKAMGKKQIAVMEELKEKFIKGCEEKRLDRVLVVKIWEDWEKFAEYAFNKSHSTCYAYIAYQTAYLKAHYPAEYMASVLTHNLNDIKKITYYIEETKRQKIEVLGPDINESDLDFTVNKKGEVRFGLAAIKSVGGKAAEEIIREREENGAFTSPYDFIKRIDQRTINKKCIEALVQAGAFDCFDDNHRAQYFHLSKSGNEETSFIEKLIRYGNKHKEGLNSSQASLFGETQEETLVEPPLTECEPWSNIEKLKHEKEMIGFYLSGHPLDKYQTEIKFFANTSIEDIEGDLKNIENKNLYIAGIINGVVSKPTKSGSQYGVFTLENHQGSKSFSLFGKDYLSFKEFLVDGLFVLINIKVKKRGWGDENQKEELELKINKIELLDEVLNNYSKGVKLHIPIENLNQEFVEYITKLAKKAKGKGKLTFIIEDYQENITITLNARKHNIATGKFIESLGDIEKHPFIRNYSIDKMNFS